MFTGVVRTQACGSRLLSWRAPHPHPQPQPQSLPLNILTLRLRRYLHSRPPAPPPQHMPTRDSIEHDAVALVQDLLARFGANDTRRNEPLNQSDASNGSFSVNSTLNLQDTRLSEPQVADPFAEAVRAMRHGDTQMLLFHLRAIKTMTAWDINDAVVKLPRTTFTEFFRALDPLRVARDYDQDQPQPTPTGMFKLLDMESSMDSWGVRRLYIALLRRLLPLMKVLTDAGHILHKDEYVALFRSAGACSDIEGAKFLWNHYSIHSVQWRNNEVFAEFLKARFLTESMYWNYSKQDRLVSPRNLHRSRLLLKRATVGRLDQLRYRLAVRKGRRSLNKEAKHMEELSRKLRHPQTAMKVYWSLARNRSFRLEEDIVCTMMVALGRSGAIRFIGANILDRLFDIPTPHAVPLQTIDEWAEELEARSEDPKPRINPTVRLMRAVVEAYGSNAEIATAAQLIEHINRVYKVPIPHDVWQDLMEWTLIMSAPPVSTAYEIAGLYSKIPTPQAVEAIWDGMTSPPYNQLPTFKHLNVLIRSLVGPGNLTKSTLTNIITYMRHGKALYDVQCRVHEAAALEFTRHQRDVVHHHPVRLGFQRERFKKQRMWFDIHTWCRSLLKRFPYSDDSPFPHPLLPAFVQEFRPFLSNPISYETPTGHVEMEDPAVESFKIRTKKLVVLRIPMRNKRKLWRTRLVHSWDKHYQSSHSLAMIDDTKAKDPMNLLAPQPDVFIHPKY
ncbi:mitochondrial ATPase expression-domain-containing protein [Astrocystis sublimbata]|nr:mitochondrial ATPase expression-domain-containing protein [Astrocystis sublimbata]KAI0191563.1 mitochondrial ATPase expression-domain-containing protein [Astrocystis sublimbata]KAI0196477.1 mitochondrial ATPase expression-domain-containing protein [Astrocystis sublimbata]